MKTGRVLAQFSSTAKAIEQLAKDGKVAAEKWINYRDKGHGMSDIGSVCRLKRQSAYGYFWRYQNCTHLPWDYQEKARGKAVRRISVISKKVLKEYPTAVDAHRELKTFDYSAFCRACRNHEELGGYLWEYVEMVDEEESTGSYETD